MRSGGQLDPATFGKRAITGNDALEQIPDEIKERAPLVQIEAHAFGHELHHQRVLAAHRLPRPCEVIPRQQVGHVLPGKVRVHIRTGILYLTVELMQESIWRKGFDHACMIALKTARQHQFAFLGAHAIRCRVNQQSQQRITQIATIELLTIVLDLIQQHRDEIHRSADPWILFEVPRHVGVVLEGVQVHPREHELAAARIAIIRLVHMPQEH